MPAIALPENLLSIPGVQPLEMVVVEVGDIGPHMRRIRLTGDSLATFSYLPGQDVMLVLATNDGRPLTRRYTIRSFDSARRMLELNIVAHGPVGIGALWAHTVRPGERVNGVGPRGKITLNPLADWHLLLGDDSAAPGILNMLEALPRGQRGIAFVEVDGPADELQVTGSGDYSLRWLHRRGTPVTEAHLLEEAAQDVKLPAGRGHAYVSGEVFRVRGVQKVLTDRDLPAEQMSPKAYWGRGAANAARGEPDERPL